MDRSPCSADLQVRQTYGRPEGLHYTFFPGSEPNTRSRIRGRPARQFQMLSAYIPIAIFVAVATGFALFTLVFSSLLHSEKYNKVKLEPYECGIEPVTDARDRYSIRYYLVAMLFVIFDKLRVFGLIEMVVFIFILVVGYYYAWQKGALEWA